MRRYLSRTRSRAISLFALVALAQASMAPSFADTTLPNLSDTEFFTTLQRVQALADENAVWFFIAFNWKVGDANPGFFSLRPSWLATERFVVRFDGKAVTSSVRVRSLAPHSDFARPILRVGDAFYSVIGALRTGHGEFVRGSVFRWDGEQFLKLDAEQATQFEKASGINLNESSHDLELRMTDPMKKAGWEYVLTVWFTIREDSFRWRGKDYKLVQEQDGLKYHVRIQFPEEPDRKPVTLLTYDGVPRPISRDELRELRKKIEESKKPAKKDPEK